MPFDSPQPAAPLSPDPHLPGIDPSSQPTDDLPAPHALPAYFLLPWCTTPNTAWGWIHTAILSLLPSELQRRERGLHSQLTFEVEAGAAAVGVGGWSESNQSYYSCLRDSHVKGDHNPYLPQYHAPDQCSANPTKQASVLWCIEAMAIDLIGHCRSVANNEAPAKVISYATCLHRLPLTWDPYSIITLPRTAPLVSNILVDLPSDVADLFRLLHTMSISADHLRRGSMCTQRDLYYSWPALFGGSQQGAERSIASLCAQLETHEVLAKKEVISLYDPQAMPPTAAAARPFAREDLGIGASAKSLVGGCLQYSLSTPSNNTHLVDVSSMREQCVLISTEVGLYSHSFRMHRDPRERVVFIVEKEATLHSLLYRDRMLQVYPGAVVICSKGYPCVAARSFLCRLLMEVHSWGMPVPFFFVMDGDPDGIGIMLSYVSALLPPQPKRRACGRGQPKGDVESDDPAVLHHMLSRFLAQPIFGHRCAVNLRWLGLRPSTIAALLDIHSHATNPVDGPITDASLSRLLRGMTFRPAASDHTTGLPIHSLRGARAEARLKGVQQECRDLVIRAEAVVSLFVRSCFAEGRGVDDPMGSLPPEVGVALAILQLILVEVLPEAEAMSATRRCAELQVVETVAHALESVGPSGSSLYSSLGLLLEVDALTHRSH